MSKIIQITIDRMDGEIYGDILGLSNDGTVYCYNENKDIWEQKITSLKTQGNEK